MVTRFFKLAESDFQSLSSFTLQWRWLEAKYDLLSESELKRIKPLAPAAAAALQFCLPWHHDDPSDPSPSGEIFSTIDILDDPHSSDACSWLGRRLPESRTPVVVSWDGQTAVLTDSDLFIARWDSFCYPSSDDVGIWPLDGLWMVSYWHEERLYFGDRNKNQAV